MHLRHHSDKGTMECIKHQVLTGWFDFPHSIYTQLELFIGYGIIFYQIAVSRN